MTQTLPGPAPRSRRTRARSCYRCASNLSRQTAADRKLFSAKDFPALGSLSARLSVGYRIRSPLATFRKCLIGQRGGAQKGLSGPEICTFVAPGAA